MRTLMEFSQQPAVHALGWTLLHFVWQGAVVAILLAIVLGMITGKSPQLRYGAACCAMLLMLLLPLVTWQHLAAAPRIMSGEITRAPNDFPSALSFQNGLTGPAEPWQGRLARKLDHSVPWVISIWFAGVILLWGRLSIGLVAARRMKSFAALPASEELQLLLEKLSRRLEVTRAIKLVNSAMVQVPTVIGWLRPVILIPVGCLVGLSASQTEALLAHELAHIRRHDYLVNIFQSVVEILLFYHPATWWISNQIRREREHCCDDLAIGISGDRLSYAKALSFLAEQQSSLPAVALGASGGSLATRIRRLLGAKERPAVSRLAATTLLTTAFVAMGLCLGAMAHAQPKGSEHTATEVIKPAQTKLPASAKSISIPAGSLRTDENSKSTSNLPSKYQRWLEEEVPYIITDTERADFKKLSTDEEREQFVYQFWERRNPNPGSAENQFKEEYYRRIAYANVHWAANIPGWKTDRGRIYIMYGPPDEIDSHPQGGGNPAKPFEIWRYRYIQDYAPPKQGTVQGKPEPKAQTVEKLNVVMKFVDACNCGDYRLQPQQ
jgi:GWxTD domain-containing protein